MLLYLYPTTINFPCYIFVTTSLFPFSFSFILSFVICSTLGRGEALCIGVEEAELGDRIGGVEIEMRCSDPGCLEETD